MTLAECPDWDGAIPPEEIRTRIKSAYESAIGAANTELIGSDSVKHWHEKMFHALTPLPYFAGNFRQDDVGRVCLGINVKVGGILGSDFRHVLSHMGLLFDNFSRTIRLVEVSWPTLSPDERALRVATAIGDLVGGFIRIHPFINGNGRTSRIIWAAALRRFGISPQFRINPRPPQPYENVMASCMSGDFLPLQLLILRALSARPQILLP